MKLFHFYRTQDHSGVSGTGAVVEGVQFTNGWCALRWVTAHSSICFYRSIEDVKAIHGHGGKTEIVIHDLEPLTRSHFTPGDRRFEILMEIIEEAARVTGYDKDPAVPFLQYQKSVETLRGLVDALARSLETNRPGDLQSA
jgi:hypothetical protein